MIMLSALLTLLIAVPIVVGFITSRGQRGVDRRHFAAFVGFGAAIVALGATIGGITATIVWLRPPQSPYDHPVEQGFVFIFSIIGLLSTGIAFFAGLFSNGIRRVALVLFVPAMAIIYALAAFSNFRA
jgi:drug/metabolite transporter (DMT)-like permease